jgi:hypothetical protein
MHTHLNRSPLCAAVLLCAALSPALAEAQSQTPSASTTVSSAPAKAATQATGPKAGSARPSALDLTAPPLNRIYGREQLQYILAADSTDTEEAQEVNVKGEKYLMPVPTSQLWAIPWALMHPSQAWRVFMPIEAP